MNKIVNIKEVLKKQLLSGNLFFPNFNFIIHCSCNRAQYTYVVRQQLFDDIFVEDYLFAASSTWLFSFINHYSLSLFKINWTDKNQYNRFIPIWYQNTSNIGLNLLTQPKFSYVNIVFE